MACTRSGVEEFAIDRLQAKLAVADFPDELEDPDQWRYGAPLTDRSDVPNAIPLLFAHGCTDPFPQISRALQQHSTPTFHVVAPSLPNFGFSSGVKEPGFAVEQYAEACHKLMKQLGYGRYVTQGGDWGFYITRAMGLLYPESCLASHINMVRAFPPNVASYSEAEKQGLERSAWFVKDGAGYNLQQRTKPQTIGYALTDSPVACLAWTYEKLHDWTENYPWTDDEVLTDRLSDWVPKAKLGVAHFPKELTVVPRSWAHTLGPVVHESEHSGGGHFAAWERPDDLVRDLQALFGKKGPCFNIVTLHKVYRNSEDASPISLFLGPLA
ncbi:Alpha/Beta hydrolase protein [Phyllosticta citrichinensis]